MIENYDPEIVENVRKQLLIEAALLGRSHGRTPFAFRVGNSQWIFSDTAGDLGILGGYEERRAFVEKYLQGLVYSDSRFHWVIKDMINHKVLSRRVVEILNDPNTVVRTDEEFLKKIREEVEKAYRD